MGWWWGEGAADEEHKFLFSREDTQFSNDNLSIFKLKMDIKGESGVLNQMISDNPE